MDKKNLFYLVRKGTNIRATYDINRVLIVTDKVAEEMLATTYLIHEKITVADYEEIFGIERTNVSMDYPDTVVPTIFTVAEDLDDINYRQIGVNCHIYNKDVEIAIVSGVHEDLWYQRHYPMGKLDLTNQVKRGRIYATVVITKPKN